MKTTLATSSIFVFLFLGVVLSAHAQSLPTPIEDNTQVFLIPAHPGPNELVNVRIENYAENLNTTEITWTLDGKMEKKAVGDKKFQFTTKDLGNVSRIKVTGSGFEKIIEIWPTGLDLLWQTKGYVPAFYKGKALYTYQSAVQFVAIPSFVGSSGAIDPKNLVYKWSRNGVVLGDLSGYGKNTLYTSGGVLAKPFKVDVEVTSADGSMGAQKSFELQGIQPQILLYENHPLYGILYNTAIPSDFTLDNKEISLLATPYFFDTNRKDDPALSYQWQMNGQTIANQAKPETLVLRRPEGSQGGEASVGLKIQKAEKTLQYAEFYTRIKFNALGENTTSVWGVPVAYAATPAEYTPLSPLPYTTTSTGKTNMNVYLLGMFKILIGVAGVLAVVMIVIGGIQYMSTDAISGKSDGKEKIKQALGGLLLAIVAWLLLETINPNLLKINAGLPTVPPANVVNPASVGHSQ